MDEYDFFAEMTKVVQEKTRQAKIEAVRELLMRYEAQCGGEFRSAMEGYLRELEGSEDA